MKKKIIQINDKIMINVNDITFKPVFSSGPGGQNINKNATAILLQYNLAQHNFPQWLINKIKMHHTKIISKNNIITIKAKSYKSQIKNKKEALKRLITIFKQSVDLPKKRKTTSIPAKEKIKRLKQKNIQSKKKELRKTPKLYD